MTLKDLAFTQISLTELEALRADNARLRVLNVSGEEAADHIKTLQAHLDHRSDVNGALRAEIERLTECLDTMNAGARIHFDERRELRAEIERLTALAEEIYALANRCDNYGPGRQSRDELKQRLTEIRDTVVRALEPKP